MRGQEGLDGVITFRANARLLAKAPRRWPLQRASAGAMLLAGPYSGTSTDQGT